MNYKQAFAVGLIAPGVMAVREQWDTVWEGSVTTTEDYSAGYAIQVLNENNNMNQKISDGEQLRLTIGNTSKVYTASVKQGVLSSLNVLTAGNAYLSAHDGYTDDGFDLFVKAGPNTYLYVYTRTVGAYNIKIERAVSA